MSKLNYEMLNCVPAVPKYDQPLYLHLCPFCGQELDYPNGCRDPLFLSIHLPACGRRPAAIICGKCGKEAMPRFPGDTKCPNCKHVFSGIGRRRTCPRCERTFYGRYKLCGRCKSTCGGCWRESRQVERTRISRKHRLRPTRCIWHCPIEQCRAIWREAKRAVSVGGDWTQIKGVECWCVICGARCTARGPSICTCCIEDIVFAAYRLKESSILVSDWLANLDTAPFSLYDGIVDPMKIEETKGQW